jgi:hypothetical protein
MNGDPMSGSESDRAEYLAEIMNMIAQDVEDRRAQRLAEFLETRDSKAIVLGVAGSDSMIGTLDLP